MTDFDKILVKFVLVAVYASRHGTIHASIRLSGSFGSRFDNSGCVDRPL